MKTQPTAEMLSRHPLEFWEAVDYFQANRRKIAKKFPKKWVAILDGRVIASDDDFGHLISRVAQTFPGRHPHMRYANALSLAEMAERFEIDEELDWKRMREEAEAEAADEVIRRMHENMNGHLNG